MTVEAIAFCTCQPSDEDTPEMINIADDFNSRTKGGLKRINLQCPKCKHEIIVTLELKGIYP